MANPQDETPTATALAERQFLQSVTVPLQAGYPTVDQKRSMTEFKIGYQISRDNKGKEAVYKVYLPSRHKGWVIMAEKNVSHLRLRDYFIL